MHLVGLDVDVVDRGLDEVDPVVQLAVARSHDVLGVGQAERHEQQARLVDVAVVLVDHRDRGVVRRVEPAQPVGDQRAAGPATEDHDPRGHRAKMAGFAGAGQYRTSRSGPDQGPYPAGTAGIRGPKTRIYFAACNAITASGSSTRKVKLSSR